MDEAITICERLIAEAQAQIDALAADPTSPRTAQDVWLGRRIGIENVRAALRATLT